MMTNEKTEYRLVWRDLAMSGRFDAYEHAQHYIDRAVERGGNKRSEYRIQERHVVTVADEWQDC